MTAEALKDLEKEVNKRKRIVSEWASQLHDLVEDRLPAGYADLKPLAESTYEACLAWKEASERLKAAQAGG